VSLLSQMLPHSVWFAPTIWVLYITAMIACGLLYWNGARKYSAGQGLEIEALTAERDTLRAEIAHLRQAQEPAKPKDMTVGMSASDYQVFTRANATYETLTFAQRHALRMVYEQPGIPVSTLIAELSRLGFCDPDHKVVNPLLETSLVQREFSGSVHPSPHQPVKAAVERRLQD
jgi:hypothetical protein